MCIDEGATEPIYIKPKYAAYSNGSILYEISNRMRMIYFNPKAETQTSTF